MEKPLQFECLADQDLAGRARDLRVVSGDYAHVHREPDSAQHRLLGATHATSV
jgi:hypothetical protein